ncbi:MAG: hypothetical protein JWP13_228 [Candidatus Saccharibacteria bacterium]|nr:hypothetical protein [Candidatus Saccharibacteria bacterium]
MSQESVPFKDDFSEFIANAEQSFALDDIQQRHSDELIRLGIVGRAIESAAPAFVERLAQTPAWRAVVYALPKNVTPGSTKPAHVIGVQFESEAGATKNSDPVAHRSAVGLVLPGAFYRPKAPFTAADAESVWVMATELQYQKDSGKLPNLSNDLVEITH